MKTFEQCCDEVAKKKFGKKLPENWIETVVTEAAELYANEFAKEKVEEAVGLSREVIPGAPKLEMDYDGLRYTKQEILDKLKSTK